MEAVTEKTCLKCKNIKDISQFHNDKSRRDGFYMYCKKCNNESRKIKYYKEKSTETYLRRKLISTTKQKAEYPVKAKARRLAYNNKNKIRKASCEWCEAEGKLQMHHPDYNKPLDVLTLCVPCHVKAHHGEIV